MAGSNSGQTVVVLGGGVGGVAAANRLRRRLDRKHRVILVNREPEFSFAASYLWVMSGQRRASQVTKPLSSLQRRGIEVVIGDVEAIDAAHRTVTVNGERITADHLVVSLGADYATDAIPGLLEVGKTFATLTGAQQLRPVIGAVTRGRILLVTAPPLYRCPAAPYEAALLIDDILRHNGVRANVDIALHSAEPGPMGVAGANVSAAVTEILASRSIDYRPSHQITSVEPGRAQFADDKSEAFDLLVYMPPIRTPAVVGASSLASSAGWIEVDRHTLVTEFPGVYAIGDNVQLPLSIGKPLPRAGVFAHAQALVVADNIVATIEDRVAAATFDGHGGCFIEIGAGKAGYGTGDFYAEPSPQVTLRAPSRRHHLAKAERVKWRVASVTSPPENAVSDQRFEATKYDQWFDTPWGRYSFEIESSVVLNAVGPLSSDMHVLDVGCGTGRLTAQLEALGATVVGLDLDSSMLEIASSRTRGRFILGDAHKIPAGDATFDRVVALTP